MTPPIYDTVAMIAAPWQILVVGVLALGLVAPQLLPRIGRMLGRMVRMEAMRRLGIPVRTHARPARSNAPEAVVSAPIEILMPDSPAATLRAESEKSLAPSGGSGRSVSIWLVGATVLAAAGTIFWVLLHAR